MSPREAVDVLHKHVQDMCEVSSEQDDILADLVEAVDVLNKLVIDAEEFKAKPEELCEKCSNLLTEESLNGGRCVHCGHMIA